VARLSIGEFAQASGLTPKALRLYDELGLLRPVEVDPRSGYRSYDRAQLEPARLVAALRGLGMPLARIRVVCALPPRAAAAEVTSYWRQVEADIAARREQAAVLIDSLLGKDIAMSDTTGSLTLAHGVGVDQGLVRVRNEDAAFAGTRLFAVADGFGAQELDGAASAAVIDRLAGLDDRDPAGDAAGDAADDQARDPLAELGLAVHEAQQAVREFTDDEPRRECGTTLTAMLWSGSQFGMAHVGDSRGYLLRGGELTQLTHDHTYVQSLVDEGKLTAEEAANHPQRARLLRALHRDGGEEPDLLLRQAHPGDRYLLCTDGLHAVIDDAAICGALTERDSAQDAAASLVGLARTAGAPDNVACVVVDVTGTTG
jgi:PPM family protein phosphatase